MRSTTASSAPRSSREATALDAVQNGLPENDRRLDAVLYATGDVAAPRRRADGAARHGRAAAAAPARCASGCRRSRAAGERYRAYATTLRDPDLAGSPGSRWSPASGRSRAARRTSTAGWSGSARWRCCSRRRGRGSPPTWCCARCGGCARVASSIADDEDLDRRVPDDDGPAELRSLAASFNAMLARLGRSSGRPRARARRHAPLRRRRRPRAAHAADERAGDARRAAPPPRAAGRAARGDAGRRAHRAAAAGRPARRPAGARARRRAGPPSTPTSISRRSPTRPSSRPRARHPDVAIDARAPGGGRDSSRGWEPGLRLLVDNLVENAAATAATAAGCASRSTTGRRCTSTTTAPGVPEDERERIFEPFARIDGDATAGLGPGPRARRPAGAPPRRARRGGDSPLGGARFTVSFSLL